MIQSMFIFMSIINDKSNLYQDLYMQEGWAAVVYRRLALAHYLKWKPEIF